MFRWTLKTRHDTETPDLFDQSLETSATELSKSTQDHSAEPLSLYGRQPERNCLAIEPTWARLGPWVSDEA